jgi:hypothetical protein
VADAWGGTAVADDCGSAVELGGRGEGVSLAAAGGVVAETGGGVGGRIAERSWPQADRRWAKLKPPRPTAAPLKKFRRVSLAIVHLTTSIVHLLSSSIMTKVTFIL